MFRIDTGLAGIVHNLHPGGIPVVTGRVEDQPGPGARIMRGEQ